MHSNDSGVWKLSLQRINFAVLELLESRGLMIATEKLETTTLKVDSAAARVISCDRDALQGNDRTASYTSDGGSESEGVDWPPKFSLTDFVIASVSEDTDTNTSKPCESMKKRN